MKDAATVWKNLLDDAKKRGKEVTLNLMGGDSINGHIDSVGKNGIVTLSEIVSRGYETEHTHTHISLIVSMSVREQR